MTPAMFETLIPIVAILATFGFPVGIVFVWKWFKLKERELQLDADLRRTSGQALEQRVQRLESIILALDSDLRQRLGPAEGQRSLLEAPAGQEGDQPGPAREPPARLR